MPRYGYIWTDLTPERIAAVPETILEQAPYATALGLTGTAKAAKAFVQAEMPGHFDIRDAWVLRGVQHEAANKRDWPIPASAVGVLEDRGFLEKQVDAGTQTGAFAVPIAGRLQAMKAPIRTGKPTNPRAMAQRKSAYYSRSGLRAGTLGLFARARTKDQTMADVLQWVFRRSIVIDRPWPFYEDVARAVGIFFGPEMEAAWNRAIKTRRL